MPLDADDLRERLVAVRAARNGTAMSSEELGRLEADLESALQEEQVARAVDEDDEPWLDVETATYIQFEL